MSIQKWQKPEYYFPNPNDASRFIILHPLYLQDEIQYNIIHKFLTFNQTAIPDIQIIKSSYLKFLLFGLPKLKDFQQSIKLRVRGNEYPNEVYMKWVRDNFLRTLLHIFKLSENGCVKLNYDYPENIERIDLLELNDVKNIQIIIEDGDYIFTINEHEFEGLKSMILEQNGIDIDYIMQYDKDLELYKQIKYQNQDTATFDEQVDAFCVYMHKLPHEIGQSVTFYNFNKLFNRQDVKLTYEILQPLLSSGQISMKDGHKIKHWTEHIPKSGRYDDILMSKEEFEQKGLGSITKQK